VVPAFVLHWTQALGLVSKTIFLKLKHSTLVGWNSVECWNKVTGVGRGGIGERRTRACWDLVACSWCCRRQVPSKFLAESLAHFSFYKPQRWDGFVWEDGRTAGAFSVLLSANTKCSGHWWILVNIAAFFSPVKYCDSSTSHRPPSFSQPQLFICWPKYIYSPPLKPTYKRRFWTRDKCWMCVPL
jgi:hypothetical protein